MTYEATDEDLDAIAAEYRPTLESTADYLRRITTELKDARAENERLTRQVDAVRALADDYRNHYEIHGPAGDDYVVEDGRCVDVDDLRAITDPTTEQDQP